MVPSIETRARKGICSFWEEARSLTFVACETSSPWEISRRRALTGLLPTEDVEAIRKVVRAQSSEPISPEKSAEK